MSTVTTIQAMEAIKRSHMRDRIVCFLDAMRPERMTDNGLTALLRDIYPEISIRDVRREIDYLQMKGLISTERNPVRWLVSMTASGVDVAVGDGQFSERATMGMEQERLSYALAKQVPAMECGFTISTSYGDIEIVAEDAEQFQRLAKRMLNQKLANAITAEKEMGDGC